ncbi:WD40-repeat-containing domain protein [Syncephalis fuscata]|nr:WD40-repeat-containing domain protein [Syncephalis fuscata]
MLPYSKQHRPPSGNYATATGQYNQEARNTGIPIPKPTNTTPNEPQWNEPRPQFDLNFNASLFNSNLNDAAVAKRSIDGDNGLSSAQTPVKKSEMTVLRSGGPARGSEVPPLPRTSEATLWPDTSSLQQSGQLASSRSSLKASRESTIATPNKLNNPIVSQTSLTKKRAADPDMTISTAKSSNKSSANPSHRHNSNIPRAVFKDNLSNDYSDSSGSDHDGTSDNDSDSDDITKNSDLSFSSSSYSDMADMSVTMASDTKNKGRSKKRSRVELERSFHPGDNESLQAWTWLLEKERTKIAIYSSKLRRASRRVYKISKKLEEYTRQLPATTTATATATATTSHSKSLSKATIDTPMKDVQSSDVSGIDMVKRRNSHSTVEVPSASNDKKTIVKSLPNSKFTYTFPLATNNEPSKLRNLHTHQWRNAFLRKPRSLLFHRLPGTRGRDPMDLIVASALDGQIRCWKYGHQRLEHIIKDSQLEKTWPEAMAWITDDILAVGAPARDPPVAQQLSLVHFSSSSRHSLLSQVQHLYDQPHGNGINVIEPLHSNKEAFSFVTAGNDKRVVVWHMERSNNLQKPTTLKSVEYLHKVHTSSIFAISHLPQFSALYSGGADNRLVAWDLAGQREISRQKLTERINHIQKNPVDPNLLLVTVSGLQDQLLLYDHRTPRDPLLTFGFRQQSRLSRYIAPSWHCDGYLIACGQQDKPHISIW